MAGKTPTSPIRAYHRLMQTMVSSSHRKAGVKPTPEELDRVSRVFQKAGGSWEQVFLGSVDDLVLLKKTLGVAVKAGVFSKSPTWG